MPNNTQLEAKDAEISYWRTLATRDHLTRLFNRYTFEQQLSKLCQGDRPFTLFLLDLNKFKEINDGAGHRAGDQVLCHLAHALSKAPGVLFRVGGDEFTLLSTCLPHQSRAVAFRLKAIAEGTCLNAFLPDELKDLRCGLSLGWASSNESIIPSDLMGLADERMYAAKAIRASSCYA